MPDVSKDQKVILCIDDDKDSGELVLAILGLHNYRVDLAPTAAEGLRKVRQNRHYNLILLDYRFDDGDGVVLCRRIRQFDAHTPILFYSSEARESAIQIAIDAGAQDFLVKPVEPDNLVEKVKYHIGDFTLQRGR